MARLRAVVTIHAPGLGGSPSDGHLAAATVNASWTASSAASISPRKRIRVATHRPYSRRKTASTVTAREPMDAARIRSLRVGRVSLDRVVEVPTEQRADLDRPLFRDRGELGPLQGLVQVGGVDDPEPGEVFLGLGVRPVGHLEVAAGLRTTVADSAPPCRPPLNTNAPASVILSPSEFTPAHTCWLLSGELTTA